MKLHFRSLFSGFVIVVGGFCCSPDALAQSGAPNPGGVRHELRALVASEPNPSSADGNQTEVSGDLTISVKVVEFTPDSQFFSVITPRFTQADRRSGASPRIIWSDTKCHRDRGLPKVSLLAVEGSVGDGPAKSEVSAKPRRLGQRIPPDEIIVQKQATAEGAQTRSDVVISTVALTKLSKWRIQLDLIARRCAL